MPEDINRNTDNQQNPVNSQPAPKSDQTPTPTPSTDPRSETKPEAKETRPESTPPVAAPKSTRLENMAGKFGGPVRKAVETPTATPGDEKGKKEDGKKTPKINLEKLNKKLLLGIGIGVVLLAALTFGGFTVYKILTKPEEPEPVVVLPPTAKEVVENFYGWHMKFVGNALISGAYKNNKNLSARFIEKVDGIRETALENGFWYDPFVCTVEKPLGVGIQEPTAGENSATTVITIDADEDFSLNVEMVKEGENWKIDDLVCPQEKEAEEREKESETTAGLYFKVITPAEEETEVVCGETTKVERVIKKEDYVASKILELLFSGPIEEEAKIGYESVFSADTAGILEEVKIDGDTATVVLNEAFLSELDGCEMEDTKAQILDTLKEFSEGTITKVTLE